MLRGSLPPRCNVYHRRKPVALFSTSDRRVVALHGFGRVPADLSEAITKPPFGLASKMLRGMDSVFLTNAIKAYIPEATAM